MNQINNLARHTRLLEIVDDTVRVRAKGRAFGEMAIVENTDGESSLAKVVDLDRDIVSLQVFSGGKGLSTGTTVNFLGRDVDMIYLKQDAFDEVDACMPRERQLTSFRMLKKLTTAVF